MSIELRPRLLSSFGGEDASQIRPLRASGAGGCDVIKVPLLEDIQVGGKSQKLDLNQSWTQIIDSFAGEEQPGEHIRPHTLQREKQAAVEVSTLISSLFSKRKCINTCLDSERHNFRSLFFLIVTISSSLLVLAVSFSSNNVHIQFLYRLNVPTSFAGSSSAIVGGSPYRLWYLDSTELYSFSVKTCGISLLTLVNQIIKEMCKS